MPDIINNFRWFRQPRELVPTIGSSTEDFLAGINVGNGLQKRYDEPTYLTFKVLFGQNSFNSSGTLLTNTNYDQMPHPLFINRQRDAVTDPQNNNVDIPREYYSTIDFLRDSNEIGRGEMLKEFITLWNELQNNYQYYFQVIDGFGDLLRAVPERGRRVTSDFRLTFTMLEGLDLRISYLLNLYKKIAWDDTYQRWVLPDMMRFFTLHIYVTEFRTFHRSSLTGPSNAPLVLNILNNISPTYLIECEMCEFDINSFNFGYGDSLSVGTPGDPATVSFSVKVGNLNEISLYPMFKHYIFNDYRINGLDRSKEYGSVKDPRGRITNPDELGDAVNNRTNREAYSPTRDGDLRFYNLQSVAQDSFFDLPHTSGEPYSGGNGEEGLRNSTDNFANRSRRINQTEPNTWIGNAVTFGQSFVENFVEDRVEKAKMTNIPKLGFSVNEALGAIRSKNFNTVLALVRRSIRESFGEGAAPLPSADLEKKIDNVFREFLVGVTSSEATDGDELELAQFANRVLNNEGEFVRIRDLSLATDITVGEETNIPNFIKNPNALKSNIATSTNNSKSIATGDVKITDNFITEGVPSSFATQGKIR